MADLTVPGRDVTFKDIKVTKAYQTKVRFGMSDYVRVNFEDYTKEEQAVLSPAFAIILKKAHIARGRPGTTLKEFADQIVEAVSIRTEAAQVAEPEKDSDGESV